MAAANGRGQETPTHSGSLLPSLSCSAPTGVLDILRHLSRPLSHSRPAAAHSSRAAPAGRCSMQMTANYARRTGRLRGGGLPRRRSIGRPLLTAPGDSYHRHRPLAPSTGEPRGVLQRAGLLHRPGTTGRRPQGPRHQRYSPASCRSPRRCGAPWRPPPPSDLRRTTPVSAHRTSLRLRAGLESGSAGRGQVRLGVGSGRRGRRGGQRRE